MFSCKPTCSLPRPSVLNVRPPRAQAPAPPSNSRRLQQLQDSAQERVPVLAARSFAPRLCPTVGEPAAPRTVESDGRTSRGGNNGILMARSGMTLDAAESFHEDGDAALDTDSGAAASWATSARRGLSVYEADFDALLDDDDDDDGGGGADAHF